MAAAKAVRPPFMSTDPRPYTKPFAKSPENGSPFQPTSAGTTSRWPWSRIAGPGAFPEITARAIGEEMVGELMVSPWTPAWRR